MLSVYLLDEMEKNTIGPEAISSSDEDSVLEISASSSVPDFASDSTILYSINGRTGRLRIENSVVFFDDLIQGLTGLPSDIDNARSEEVRSKRNIESVRYGSSQCWVPAGTELVAKNHLTRLKKSATITKKLEDMFSCEKSCFSLRLYP